MTKREARKLVKDRSKKLDFWYREKASQSILRQVTELECYETAETVFCYVSTEEEVNTWPLIARSLEQGKRVAVPRCIGKGRMEIRQISNLKQLQKGAYGIMEPSKECPLIKKEEIDLGIIPCVSADQRGNRLGHGEGFYDRFLEGVKFSKVLLCFQALMLDEIPIDEYDVTMDQVICEGEENN